jgi:hypothetical protein
MVLHGGQGDQVAARLAKAVAEAAAHHQDAVAAAAVGRLDDEILARAQNPLQILALVLFRDHGVEFRHGDAARQRELLGQQLVVHQRIQAALVVGHDEIGVALVHAQHAEPAQAARGGEETHARGVPWKSRKRRNSDNR